jgi:hypothetical protein
LGDKGVELSAIIDRIFKSRKLQMKKTTLLFLSVTLIVCLFSSCAEENIPQPGSDPTGQYDQQISVTLGKEFTISSKPNASTGWRLWVKDFDKIYLILVEDRALSDSFEGHDFIFKALKKGKTDIILESKPYWWKDIPADKQKDYPPHTVIYSITVN